MKIFNENGCISICLKNTNKYVNLAVEDLRNDLERINVYGVRPRITDEEEEWCIVIEENSDPGCEPIINEGFEIKREGNRIRILADGYLGTMWGIYTFCEKILGVDPCYLFNDLAEEKKYFLEVEEIHIADKPKSFGFRGVFINDEDLLTGWKDGGGIRYMDYHWYGLTVDKTAMDMVVETALRLKFNLVIPASFLDIDNQPEKLLADCVANRGIYISQHHLEPLGLSHFTLENYCRKFGKKGEYSYIQCPELLEEAWDYYVRKWAEYDNVVWQIGLRGKADRPVWEEETPTREELATYAEFIGNAMKRQKEIIMEVTEGKAKYFTSTLWMEGSSLMAEGLLETPADTIMVFSDTGPNQMYGDDYQRVPRNNHIHYGIYYHLQYFCCGPHLAPQTGLDKLFYNTKLAYDKGDNSYYIVNASNMREFVFELAALAEMLWDIEGFCKNEYLDRYCSMYGEYAGEMKTLISAYYAGFPEIDVDYLSKHHEQYFNYSFDKAPEGIKNFVLKEGNVLEHGARIVSKFHDDLGDRLCKEFYETIKPVIPTYIQICDDFSRLSDVVSEPLQNHIRVKWLCYAVTLRCIYEWYVRLYEAKLAVDKLDSEGMKKSLRLACEKLEEYLTYRKCAEYGTFKHWYRGDLKMNVKKKLYDTKQLLGQTPEFLAEENV